MAVVARRAIELLEAEPREPGFLNFAGVAFYELGELGAAERLFQAARRLDPDLAHVANNLDELQARRRARLQPPPLPPAVRAALRDLAPRAKRVAAAARPAEGLTLSLCMIVKDEEEMLPRCLAAVRDAVDEIVIVDTGSTDRTREIALEFGAKLIDLEWTGSFSDARNVSFDAATGDWLMFLDADEVLVEGDGERLRALTGQTWREAFYLLETNHTGTLEDGTAVTHNALRVFRNRPGTASRGASTSRSPTTCPRTCPSASRSPTCASSTSATSARCATRRRSRAATSSCSSARSPRASTARSCIQPRLRVRRRGRRGRRARQVRARLGCASATTSTSPRTASCRRSPAGSCARCA